MSNITSKDPRADLEARSAGFPRVSTGGLFYLSDPEQWMKTRLEEAMRSAAAAEADYEIAKHLEMEPVKKQKTMHALSTLCKIRHNEALSQIAVLHEYSEPGQTKECSRNATTFNSMVPLPCSLSIQASEAMKQFEGFSRLTLQKLLTNNGRLSLGLILFHSVEPHARASLVDNHLGVGTSVQIWLLET